ncbi:hypothetical protein ACWDE0_04775 [Streptomyces sp. 900105755]
MTSAVRDPVGRTRGAGCPCSRTYAITAPSAAASPQPSRSRHSTHAPPISYTSAERPAPSSVSVRARP